MVNVDGAMIIEMNSISKIAARPDGEQSRSSTKLTCNIQTSTYLSGRY